MNAIIELSATDLDEVAGGLALPGECSIGTLASGIFVGAATGAIAGAITGPGAIGAGIFGAAVGASGAAVGCAVAIITQ